MPELEMENEFLAAHLLCTKQFARVSKEVVMNLGLGHPCITVSLF